MKKISLVVLLTLFAVLLFTACSNGKITEDKIKEDLNKKGFFEESQSYIENIITKSHIENEPIKKCEIVIDSFAGDNKERQYNCTVTEDNSYITMKHKLVIYYSKNNGWDITKYDVSEKDISTKKQVPDQLVEERLVETIKKHIGYEHSYKIKTITHDYDGQDTDVVNVVLVQDSNYATIEYVANLKFEFNHSHFSSAYGSVDCGWNSKCSLDYTYTWNLSNFVGKTFSDDKISITFNSIDDTAKKAKLTVYGILSDGMAWEGTADYDIIANNNASGKGKYDYVKVYVQVPFSFSHINYDIYIYDNYIEMPFESFNVKI